MYNASFYPTPPEVAEKMLAKVGKLYDATRCSNPRRARATLPMPPWESWIATTTVAAIVHCIEIEEPELSHDERPGLSAGRTDLLTFWPDGVRLPDHHEPTFANGEAHLLHAWENWTTGTWCACSTSRRF